MRQDSPLTLVIDSLAHDGRGIGRLPCGEASAPAEHPDATGCADLPLTPRSPQGAETGRGLAVFVAGALPGETVRCRVVAAKPRYLEAELLAVRERAPDAVPPLCPHHAPAAPPGQLSGQLPGCGGCPLQTMAYATQCFWKERLARDALVRIGRLDPSVVERASEGLLPSPLLTGFRNRMTFAFGQDAAGGLVLGQRQRGGIRVTPTPGCVLLPEGGRALLAVAREVAAESGLAAWMPPGRSGRRGSGFWRFLCLRQGYTPDAAATESRTLPQPRWWALCLTSPGTARERAAASRLGERLLAAGAAAFIHEERHAPDLRAQGQRRILCLDARGRETPEAAILCLPLGDGTTGQRLFALDAASFFQVHTRMAQGLAAVARDMAVSAVAEAGGRGGLLDLCCGVGAPGQLLAPLFDHSLGVELDAAAVALARRNAAQAGLRGCAYAHGDAGAFLRERAAENRRGSGERWRMALADPPRAGLDTHAVTALLELAPPYLLYISCNAATLGRDAARLSHRYDLVRLAGVDMFPHTPHLEVCTLWRRR